MKLTKALLTILVAIILTISAVGCSNNAVKDSGNSYKQGLQQMASSKFDEAIASFELVVKEDTSNYNNAQDKINICKQSMMKKYSDIIKNLYSQKKYSEIDEQINYLSTYTSKIPQNILDIRSQTKTILAKQKAETDIKEKELARIKADKDKREQLAKEKKVKREALIEAAEEEKSKAAEAEAARVAYDTGITYEQLARTPDSYKGMKVKFYGKVIQVVEGDNQTDLRIEINDNSDNVLYVTYDPKISPIRILQNDHVNIKGVSQGIYTYESTLGGSISIPLVTVDEINTNGDESMVNENNSVVNSDNSEESTSTDYNKLISDVVDNYEYSLIEAINNDDFSLVEPYLSYGSSLYKSPEKLVQNLFSKGTKEELVDYEIKDISNLGDVIKIKVHESFNITKQNQQAVYKEFDWTYTGVVNGDNIQLSNIEK
jgi:hypothetical protein